MKKQKLSQILIPIFLLSTPVSAAEQFDDAKAAMLVQRSEDQTLGDSLKATVTMKITREQNSRDMKFKFWLSHQTKALIKILEPKKDLDSGSLRIGMSLWQYLPNINRVVRVPPSMMLQSWMGSDFTNDDLVKTSSLTRDYTHQFDGKDSIGDDKVVKIICLPRPDSPVVWGKVRLWLRTKDSVPLRQEFYSEHGDLLKVSNGSDVKTFGRHTTPTTWVMTVERKPGNQTLMHFDDVVFDESIADSIFSQENLRSGQ